MKYQSQQIALVYITVALALFAIQVTMGLIIGYIYVQPNFLSEILPFSVGRMVHTNALVVWLLTGFFGAAYFLIPEGCASIQAFMTSKAASGSSWTPQRVMTLPSSGAK